MRLLNFRTLTVAFVLAVGLTMSDMPVFGSNTASTSGEYRHNNRRGQSGNAGGVQQTPRPGNPGNFGNPGNNRPNSGQPGFNNRPNNGNNKPGGNHNDWNKPNQGQPIPPQANRPGNGWNPNPVRPPHGPGNPPHLYPGGPRPEILPPPVRPYRPAWRPIPRPYRPADYRPIPGQPTIAGILGMTFGMALGTSLDYLLNMGYGIQGYNNNTIYLRDVSDLGYIWDDAVIRYGVGGMLAGAQFSYSTSYGNMSRYSTLYNLLCNRYGAPVAAAPYMGGPGYTWMGGVGEAYITLQYYTHFINGIPRYYTTLTYSN